jgi:hypothetical protein
MKRKTDKRRKSGKSRVRRDECTIPPEPAKHILNSFTLSSLTSRRAIKDYVESQAREETVLHAEKVKSEHVYGQEYDCWDVHTDADRYWVITAPTNLYSQKFFPSLDFTISFHVGVMARVMHRERGAASDGQKSRVLAVWRRWEDAAAAYDAADEIEEFQAVGMRCRECLIQLVRSLSKPEMVPQGQEVPQKANVIAWCELIANHVAGGSSSERIRGHLKAISRSCWELAGWLTHVNTAKRADAAFVLGATQNLISTYSDAVIRFESGAPEQCPKCGSHCLEVGFNPDLMPRPYTWECEKCHWVDERMQAKNC